MDCSLLDSCPWKSPGKNTGVRCNALQGIFPAQGLNLGLPRCRQILSRLSHQGKDEGTPVSYKHKEFARQTSSFFQPPAIFFQWIQILGLHLKLVQDISSRAFSRSYLCSPLSPNKAAETELQSHVSFFLRKKTFLHRLQKRWPCGMFKQLAKLKAVKDALLKLSTPFEHTARRAVFSLL